MRGADQAPQPASEMQELVITATRLPQAPSHLAASARVLDSAAVRASPALRVDAMLRLEPSFSLFRRSDSLIAHPTAQGVSLRGLGPSGASRSLVLLDGVPLNDPFGGWVMWSKIPRDAVSRVEIIPGGGATAWGNAALGGVVQVFTFPPRLAYMSADGPTDSERPGWRGHAEGSLVLGDFGTRRVGGAVSRSVRGRSIVQVFGEGFSTDGFRLVAPEDRGPIDVPAWSRHHSLTGRLRVPAGPHAEATATVRSFRESRGNGTPYQRNGSRETFASAALAGQTPAGLTWQAAAYVQDQSFSSTFSAVNAARTFETPASDQYDVPAQAAGANWTGVWLHAGEARTAAGADFRHTEGETRERYLYTNGSFARERVAGGTQQFAGMYALHERPVSPAVRVTAGARVDAWSDRDGHRRERELSTGASLRDDRHTRDRGIELSPGAGFVWSLHSQWLLRGNAQHAFRRPTLNELYRPFRQGSAVTEANAGLRTERVTTAEIGFERTFTRSVVQDLRPRLAARRNFEEPWLTLGGTLFWNELRDAVANVTLARGPGTFPLFGQLPAGGVGRQRLNLDRLRVRGFEASVSWTRFAAFPVQVKYLYNDATVRRAGIAPMLAGKRVAQVPRHSGSFGGTWQLPWKITFTPRLRWMGRQYEDDENTMRLGEAWVVDVGVARPLGAHLELFVNLENAGDARIETGRSPNGVVSLGTPRLAFGGIRGRW